MIVKNSICFFLHPQWSLSLLNPSYSSAVTQTPPFLPYQRWGSGDKKVGFGVYSCKEKIKVKVHLNDDQTVKKYFNQCFDKGRLKNFVLWFLLNYGENKTVHLVEQLKNIGFYYASNAGISLGIDDLKIPPKKADLIYDAEKLTLETIIQYKRGEITGVERFQRLIDTWHRTSEVLKQEVINHFEKTDILNPVYMMAFSGARGNISQVRQLVGMRGLMADPQGQIIDFPIRSNFREGLTLTEYIISSYGARKGIVDTALRTANAGYLTRRLVDVAQHVIITNFDCQTKRGIFVTNMKEGNKIIHSLSQRIVGRVLARDLFIIEKKNYKQKFASRNDEITAELAFKINKNFDKVFIRSSLTCEKLVCQLCYGWSLAQGKLVSIGEAVGVVAAQSIGEPGTQLTMRTFHTGGVFSGDISDQIKAPFNGFIEYSSAIPGSLIRTPEGKIAFLTKGEGSFIVHPTLSNNISSKVSDKTRKYKIPHFTLLYMRNGQSIIEKEVIAQISSISQKTNATDRAELTIKSEIEGQFYSKALKFREIKVGPTTPSILDNANVHVSNSNSNSNSNSVEDEQSMDMKRISEKSNTQQSLSNDLYFKKKNDPISIFQNIDPDKLYEAWTWGYAWILSGKIYEFKKPSPSFPIIGDFLNSKSCMTVTNWSLSHTNGNSISFLYKKRKPSLFTKENFALKKVLPVQTTSVLSLGLKEIRFKKFGYVFELSKELQFNSNFNPYFYSRSNKGDNKGRVQIKKENNKILTPFLKDFTSNFKSAFSIPKKNSNDFLFFINPSNNLNDDLFKEKTINTYNQFSYFLQWFYYKYNTKTGGSILFENPNFTYLYSQKNINEERQLNLNLMQKLRLNFLKSRKINNSKIFWIPSVIFKNITNSEPLVFEPQIDKREKGKQLSQKGPIGAFVFAKAKGQRDQKKVNLKHLMFFVFNKQKYAFQTNRQGHVFSDNVFSPFSNPYVDKVKGFPVAYNFSNTKYQTPPLVGVKSKDTNGFDGSKVKSNDFLSIEGLIEKKSKKSNPCFIPMETKGKSQQKINFFSYFTNGTENYVKNSNKLSKKKKFNNSSILLKIKPFTDLTSINSSMNQARNSVHPLGVSMALLGLTSYNKKGKRYKIRFPFDISLDPTDVNISFTKTVSKEKFLTQFPIWEGKYEKQRKTNYFNKTILNFKNSNFSNLKSFCKSFYYLLNNRKISVGNKQYIFNPYVESFFISRNLSYFIEQNTMKYISENNSCLPFKIDQLCYISSDKQSPNKNSNFVSLTFAFAKAKARIKQEKSSLVYGIAKKGWIYIPVNGMVKPLHLEEQISNPISKTLQEFKTLFVKDAINMASLNNFNAYSIYHQKLINTGQLIFNQISFNAPMYSEAFIINNSFNINNIYYLKRKEEVFNKNTNISWVRNKKPRYFFNQNIFLPNSNLVLEEKSDKTWDLSQVEEKSFQDKSKKYDKSLASIKNLKSIYLDSLTETFSNEQNHSSIVSDLKMNKMGGIAFIFQPTKEIEKMSSLNFKKYIYKTKENSLKFSDHRFSIREKVPYSLQYKYVQKEENSNRDLTIASIFRKNYSLNGSTLPKEIKGLEVNKITIQKLRSFFCKTKKTKLGQVLYLNTKYEGNAVNNQIYATHSLNRTHNRYLNIFEKNHIDFSNSVELTIKPKILFFIKDNKKYLFEKIILCNKSFDSLLNWQKFKLKSFNKQTFFFKRNSLNRFDFLINQKEKLTRKSSSFASYPQRVRTTARTSSLLPFANAKAKAKTLLSRYLKDDFNVFSVFLNNSVLIKNSFSNFLFGNKNFIYRNLLPFAFGFLSEPHLWWGKKGNRNKAKAAATSSHILPQTHSLGVVKRWGYSFPFGLPEGLGTEQPLNFALNSSILLKSRKPLNLSPYLIGYKNLSNLPLSFSKKQLFKLSYYPVSNFDLLFYPSLTKEMTTILSFYLRTSNKLGKVKIKEIFKQEKKLPQLINNNFTIYSSFSCLIKNFFESPCFSFDLIQKLEMSSLNKNKTQMTQFFYANNLNQTYSFVPLVFQSENSPFSNKQELIKKVPSSFIYPSTLKGLEVNVNFGFPKRFPPVSPERDSKKQGSNANVKVTTEGFGYMKSIEAQAKTNYYSPFNGEMVYLQTESPFSIIEEEPKTEILSLEENSINYQKQPKNFSNITLEQTQFEVNSISKISRKEIEPDLNLKKPFEVTLHEYDVNLEARKEEKLIEPQSGKSLPFTYKCMFLTRNDLISYYLPRLNITNFKFRDFFSLTNDDTYFINETLIKFLNSSLIQYTIVKENEVIENKNEFSQLIPNILNTSNQEKDLSIESEKDSEHPLVLNISEIRAGQPLIKKSIFRKYSTVFSSKDFSFWVSNPEGVKGKTFSFTPQKSEVEKARAKSKIKENNQSFTSSLFSTSFSSDINTAIDSKIASKQTSISLLGDFYLIGDSICETSALSDAKKQTVIQASGQVIHYNNKKVTIRRAQPIFISPKGILHKFDGEFIDPKSPVITLSYQRLKTGDIIQGIPKVEQFFEARTTKRGRLFRDSLPSLLKALFKRYQLKFAPEIAVRQSFYKIQQIIVDGVQRVYKSQGVTISDKHLEVIVKQMTSKVRILDGSQTGFFPGEVVDLLFVEKINQFLIKKIAYEPLVLGITKASLEVDSFLSASSFQQTTRVLSQAAIYRKRDFLKGLKENVILGNLIPAGTGFLVYLDDISR